MPVDGSNGWNEWSKHVLYELSRLTESNENVRTDLQKFKMEITNELVKKSEMTELRGEMNIIREEVANTRRQSAKDLSDFAQLASNTELKNAVDLATMKTEMQSKATVRGALAGAIPAAVVLVVVIIEYMLGK